MVVIDCRFGRSSRFAHDLLRAIGQSTLGVNECRVIVIDRKHRDIDNADGFHVSTQLDSITPEKFPPRRYEQFDVRGANETRVVDVISQTLADAISGCVEGKRCSVVGLLSSREIWNKENEEKLREFS